MVYVCCVPNCKDDTEEGTIMRSLPIYDEPVYDIWVNRIGNPALTQCDPQIAYKRYRVCDRHFSHFCRSEGTKRLNFRSLPTLHLPNFHQASTEENSQFLEGYREHPEQITSVGMSNPSAEIWRQTDAVCFDVDSTVIQEEGLDELAKFCNKGDEVISLTKKAMSGKMTFQDSLKIRLDIIQPSRTQVRDFIRTKLPTLTPGIRKLVELLHDQHIPVYLISGGFRSIITPIANQLNIPLENIYANRLKFYYTDEYAGFDESAPTSRTGGKAIVIDMLKRQHGYNNLVLIGDGMTDLEASPPADLFIGYGGNVVREEVKTKSKWFITDFNELVEAYEQQ